VHIKAPKDDLVGDNPFLHVRHLCILKVHKTSKYEVDCQGLHPTIRPIAAQVNPITFSIGNILKGSTLLMLKDLMTCIHSFLLDLSSDLLLAVTSYLGKKGGIQVQPLILHHNNKTHSTKKTIQVQPLILHHNNKTHSAKKTIQGGKCENGSSFNFELKVLC